MTTQVSTSHTVQTRAPLKVPRRPQRNHVTLAIQKLLPYAVVFLLSLVLYSALRPTKQTPYPPYSPPNMGEEPFTDTYGELGEFAKDVISRRAELFNEVMRKSESSSDTKAAEWKAWADKQASELRQKIDAAKAQGDKSADKAKDIISDMKRKSGVVGADLKDSAMDAAEWWKAYGEGLMENANKVGSETQQFAYDAMYSWKQKAESMKEAAKDKLEDVKETAKDKLADAKETAKDKLEDVKDASGDLLEAGKRKVEGVVEKASEGLQDISRDTFRTAQRVVEKVADIGKEVYGKANLDTAAAMGKETLEKASEIGKDTLANTKEALENVIGKDNVGAAQEKLSDAKDAASEMLSSASHKVQQAVGGAVEELGNRVDGIKEGLSQAGLPSLSPPITRSAPVGSLIERVKSGLVEDEEVRHAISMKEEWDKVGFEQKVESIVQQVCFFGGDAVDEVLHQLERERDRGTCAEYPVCPK